MTPRSTASAVVFANRFRDGKRWISLAAAYEMATTTRAYRAPAHGLALRIGDISTNVAGQAEPGPVRVRTANLVRVSCRSPSYDETAARIVRMSEV